MTIFHLVWRPDWDRDSGSAVYRPPSLAIEGFVHATREADKLLESAGLFFPLDRTDDLLIVHLDETQVGAPVRYEDPGVGHLFPHIYGPVSLAAVTAVSVMDRGPDGWRLPDGFG